MVAAPEAWQRAPCNSLLGINTLTERKVRQTPLVEEQAGGANGLEWILKRNLERAKLFPTAQASPDQAGNHRDIQHQGMG